MPLRLLAPLLLNILCVSGAVAQGGPPGTAGDLVVGAEGASSQHVAVAIEGYTRVHADRLALPFVLSAEGAPVQSEDVALSYATNYAVGQSLMVEVMGDLDGVELGVELVDGSLQVERVANGGSAGQFYRLKFLAPGAQVLAGDIGQVVANCWLRYTARLLPGVSSGDRIIDVIYTISG